MPRVLGGALFFSVWLVGSLEGQWLLQKAAASCKPRDRFAGAKPQDSGPAQNLCVLYTRMGSVASRFAYFNDVSKFIFAQELPPEAAQLLSAVVTAADDASHDFAETTLRNRGVNVRFFKDMDEAPKWLGA